MTGRRDAARWLAVRLGLFAVLFQAILFGWHHHDPMRSGHLPVPVAAKQTTPTQPVDDEDGCEICQVLHHLTAASVDTAIAPLSFSPTRVAERGHEAFFTRLPPRGFLARAPPVA